MSGSLLAAGLVPVSWGLSVLEPALAAEGMDSLCLTAKCDEDLDLLHEEAEALRLQTPPPSPRRTGGGVEAQEMVHHVPLVMDSLLFNGLLVDKGAGKRVSSGQQHPKYGCAFASEDTRLPSPKVKALQKIGRTSKHQPSGDSKLALGDVVETSDDVQCCGNLATQILGGLRAALDARL